MYLHLGQDTMINTKDIVGIFDLDTTTLSKKSVEYLNQAEKQKQVVYTSTELPKSFVVAAGPVQKVYISQLSSATLKGRVGQLAKGRLKFP